jgi:hypothetical protein
MAEPVVLTVEEFPRLHPALHAPLLVEHARVALAAHHASPASFQVHRGDAPGLAAVVHFDRPHPLSADTLEREDFVEKGAIVLAGLLLARFEGKQITRVVRRGARVDYFVGERPGDFRWIVEVSGTDAESFASRRREKRDQLGDSLYHRPPHSKDGFVAVTRFAPVAATALDPVPGAR